MRCTPCLLLLAAACAPTRDDGPDPVDTPVVDTDTDVDTTPADSDDVPAVRIASVRIVPESPRWDDDLHCEVTTEHGDADVWIHWTVDGTRWRGAVVDGVRPKDTVPHLEQTGGQKWSCTAHLRLQEVEATKVRIEPPVPMVTVPAGSADMEFSTGTRGVRTITHPFLIATHEMSRATWEGLGGWPLALEAPTPAASIWLTWHEAAVFANALSVRDGLPACYACTGQGADAVCEVSPDLPSCLGYRMPTLAEWEFAAREAGAHDDMLPAGGNFEPHPPEWEDQSPSVYDPRVTGPNAPPHTHVSDQCIFRPNADTPTGSLIPNALGLYDLCGGRSEWTSDRGYPSNDPSLDDPIYTNTTDAPNTCYGRGHDSNSGASTMDLHSIEIQYCTRNASTIRLARTLP